MCDSSKFHITAILTSFIVTFIRRHYQVREDYRQETEESTTVVYRNLGIVYIVSKYFVDELLSEILKLLRDPHCYQQSF